VHDLVDAGLADLDDDFATIGQLRCVYLPDRGAAERRVVEPGEDSGGRRPEVFLDHLGDQLRGQRRDVVLHLRELCAVSGRQGCRSASRAPARA